MTTSVLAIEKGDASEGADGLIERTSDTQGSKDFQEISIKMKITSKPGFCGRHYWFSTQIPSGLCTVLRWRFVRLGIVRLHLRLFLGLLQLLCLKVLISDEMPGG